MSYIAYTEPLGIGRNDRRSKYLYDGSISYQAGGSNSDLVVGTIQSVVRSASLKLIDTVDNKWLAEINVSNRPNLEIKLFVEKLTALIFCIEDKARLALHHVETAAYSSQCHSKIIAAPDESYIVIVTSSKCALPGYIEAIQRLMLEGRVDRGNMNIALHHIISLSEAFRCSRPWVVVSYYCRQNKA